MKNGKYTGEELNKSWIKYLWFKDNQLHREDGPAVERFDGTKAWFYHNEYINCESQAEFERIINLLSFK